MITVFFTNGEWVWYWWNWEFSYQALQFFSFSWPNWKVKIISIRIWKFSCQHWGKIAMFWIGKWPFYRPVTKNKKKPWNVYNSPRLKPLMIIWTYYTISSHDKWLSRLVWHWDRQPRQTCLIKSKFVDPKY